MVIVMINFKKILASTALVSLMGIGSSFAVTNDLKTPEELKGAKIRLKRINKSQTEADDEAAPTRPETEPLDTTSVKPAEPEIDLDALMDAAFDELEEKFPSPTVAAPTQNAPIPTVAEPEEKFPIPTATIQQQEIPKVPTLSRKQLRRQQREEFAEGLVSNLFNIFVPRIIEKVEHSLEHERQRQQNDGEIDRHIRQREANRIKYNLDLRDSEIRKLIRQGLLKEKK